MSTPTCEPMEAQDAPLVPVHCLSGCGEEELTVHPAVSEKSNKIAALLGFGFESDCGRYKLFYFFRRWGRYIQRQDVAFQEDGIDGAVMDVSTIADLQHRSQEC
jgi:hypothetical protein